jgi:hypothetical protein
MLRLRCRRRVADIKATGKLTSIIRIRLPKIERIQVLTLD